MNFRILEPIYASTSVEPSNLNNILNIGEVMCPQFPKYKVHLEDIFMGKLSYKNLFLQ